MSGFMNSSNGDGGRSRDRSARHIMINQISRLEKSEEAFELDGQPLKHALVAGTVTDVKPLNNRTLVELTDGTGTTSVTLWDVTEERPLDLKFGAYALAYVEVRSFNDRTQLTASRVIQPVPFSQILFHETSALKDHLAATGRGGKGVGAGAAAGAAAGAGAVKSEGAYGSDMYGDNERLKNEVLQVLTNEEGRSIDFLMREFGATKEKLTLVMGELDNAGQTWNDGETWFLTAD